MTPKKLLEVINEFSKVSGYKMNIQKYVVFLYTNRDQKEKLNHPIYHHVKKNKIPKETKDLYSKNYKQIQMKEIADDTNRWKDTPYSLIGKSILPK